MQRSYEVMFIVRPDLLEEDMDKLITTLQGHATTAGATIQNTEKMGKRRLAYDVKKFSDGQYVLFVLQADGKAIHELERRLRVSEPVIKFITVRTDEEKQRLDKVTASGSGRESGGKCLKAAFGSWPLALGFDSLLIADSISDEWCAESKFKIIIPCKQGRDYKVTILKR
jgi:small subunit ribosomal protein S6